MNILQLLKDRFTPALHDFLGAGGPDVSALVEMIRPAQDTRFGDYQANFAMGLARQIQGNPREIATQVVARLQIDDLCHPPEVAGPGFINLKLRDEWLESQVNAAAREDRLGVPPVAAPRTIVVDYSSPNVAKPMHVGHLRSTVIGDALTRVQRFLGHHVIADNHIGDWGTQFGMIIFGYKHLLDPANYQQDAVGELARLYRLVNQLSDYHAACQELPTAQATAVQLAAEVTALEQASTPGDKAAEKTLKKRRSEAAAARAEIAALEKKIAAVQADPQLSETAARFPAIARQARDETARLHAGDAENRRLWEEFLPLCRAALNRMYQRLEIHFDLELGESFYDPMLAPVVEDLERLNLATESEGATVVFSPGFEAPFIIRKADGAFTYATTDLATIRYRVETLHADEILYVVDARQSEHFRQLFTTARNWGYQDVGLQHVSFGTVMGQDGRPYKTRSGDTVGLESLIDEAVAKASSIVAANDDAKCDAEGRPTPDLSPADRDRIAEMVGIGGIKYADLMHNRESDYIFDADRMLAMSGNTATYLQYAYARMQGIFRRGNIQTQALRGDSSPLRIVEAAERKLALQLARYAEVLAAVAADSRPNVLTQYLYDLSGDLTSFYDQCPVLKAADADVRNSRLRLCDFVARVLQHGLGLLGISVPEQM